VSLSSNPFTLEWHKKNANQLIIVQENGDVKLVDKNAGSGEKLEWHQKEKDSLHQFSLATIAKFSHTKEHLLAIGTVAGSVVFLDTAVLKSTYFDCDSEMAAVVDIDWDLGESNILISLASGKILLLQH
jgi:hypothetical protein